MSERTAPPIARADVPGGSSYAPLWWALLVVPLAIVLMVCSYWEPVLRDGWGHVDWYRSHSLGLGSLRDVSWEMYELGNPRLGQLATLLLYARGPYHVVAAPMIELGLFAGLTALALGRWPSVRRSDDALVAALIIGIIAVCAPQLGPMLFYRPFVGNYTFGLALNVLWLLPYRFELASSRPPRRWLAPIMLVLGFAAGLCNEHTGPTVFSLGALAALAAITVSDRASRGARGRWLWMAAGLVGLALGYLALYGAPAQHLRYGGLADRAGIVERITDRGVLGNLAVLAALGEALLGALPLVVVALVVGLVERRRRGEAARALIRLGPSTGPAGSRDVARWVPLALGLGGFACTVTLLASPRIGPRLYFASVALIAAALAAWLNGVLLAPRVRALYAVAAAAALIYVAARLVVIHSVVGPIGELRRDRIEHGARGSVVTVPPYPYAVSRYFLGDDFAVPSLRRALAAGYGLAAVEVAPDPPPQPRTP